MPGWFTKSKQARTKFREGEPQPFEVACDCGQLTHGTRQRRHQTVDCSGCGATLFVLPADVYPPVARTRKSHKNKRRQQASSIPTTESQQIAQPEQIAVEPIPEEEVDLSTAEEQTKSPAAEFSPAKRQPKLITPFRIVMLSMAAIMISTVWWGLRVRALDTAARVVQNEREAAHAALKQGDVPQAAAHYRRACRALEVLGRDDVLSRQTCQLAKETNAAANLTRRPFLMIVEEAHQTIFDAGSDDERGTAELHALDFYAGEWIVMETSLTPLGNRGDSVRWVLDYPFTIGTTAVEIDANLPLFATLRLKHQPQRVLFAAQLAGCHLRQDPRQTLVIEFNPDTAFLWANAETLKTMGLVVGDEDAAAATIELLVRQARMVEVTP